MHSSSISTDESDLKYLKSEDIGKVIAKGLAELYSAKPKFPVEYLSNWLFNYQKQKQNETKISEVEENKKKLREHYQAQQEQIEAQKAQEKAKAEQEANNYESFLETIKNAPYHQELLTETFPEKVKELKNLTGVYVGNLGFRWKEVTDEDEGDENAHLLQADAKVINYVGASTDHQQLMMQQVLDLEKGITADVFKEKEAEQEVQEDEEGQQIVKAPKQNYIYVADVVKEQRLHYFGIPRLGAYIAVPIVYNSCLVDQSSFDSGLEERQKFNTAVQEQQAERQQKQEAFDSKLREMQEAGEDTAELEATFKAEKETYEEVKEAEFQTVKREFVLCCDTLGQDREIQESDRADIEALANLFAKSWECQEKKFLSDDIDLQLKYLVELPAATADMVAGYVENEEKSIQEKAPQIDELKDKDEKEYNYEIECARLEKIKEQLGEKDIRNFFLDFCAKFRILKFQGILQNILYLLGYKREEINIEGTHILDWKKVSTEFVNNQLFDSLQAFNHRGAKPDPVKPYALINRLIAKVEKYDQEQVDSYNLCYGRMLKYLKLILSLRKLDIEIRRHKIEQQKLEIENKTQEVQRMKDEKEKALEDKKLELQEEELAQFPEEDWKIQWDQDHPLPVIPPEVEDDIDNDIEND